MDNDGRTPLSRAAERGHIKVVELLIKDNRVNPDLRDKEGRTPLSWAVQSGDVQIMQLLQRNGASPDFKDRDGRTPLSQAAEHGQEMMIKHLLAQNSVDPDSIDKHGRTPLWWAAAAGHSLSTRLLLERHEVDPGSKDDNGGTPLSRAVENGHKGTIREFIGKDKVTLYMLAAKGNLTHLRILIKEGYQVDTRGVDGQAPLHAAASSGHVNITEELLSRKALINCKDYSGRTPLQLAIQYRHQEIIRLLLENSAKTTGILPSQWLVAFNREASDILELSQISRGKKIVQFSQGRPLQLSKSTRRISLFAHYSMWSKYSTWNLNSSHQCHMDVSLQRGPSEMTYKIQGCKNYLGISVTGSFPTEQKERYQEQSVELHWDKCAIAWTMVCSSKTPVGWQSMDHFSMLPHCWLPEDGANFFALFVQQLKTKWLMFCTSADERLSQRRLDQLCSKGNSIELIHYLAEDAQEWAKLRKALRTQVQAVRDFIRDYCRYCEQEYSKTMRLPIDQFDTDVNEKINQLDQTVKDLLQFEFAWVSINEAHRSTSIATSMKRLSWITFIFLPAMFTSSLFGMNVDILQSNPDWRWYLLFSGGCLILTVLVWLLSRHGEIKRFIEKYPSNRFQRRPNSPTEHKQRLKTDLQILPIYSQVSRVWDTRGNAS
ncbi:ankyrin, partial [Paraphaeosphaeria sporulosa]